MARIQKLKVYRTPIGFHDAYVAAPSQKAALEAWGSDANLFAHGLAEVVTDEALTREPLEHPGKIIKRLRGVGGRTLGRASRKCAETEARQGRERAIKAAGRPRRLSKDITSEAENEAQAAPIAGGG